MNRYRHSMKDRRGRSARHGAFRWNILQPLCHYGLVLDLQYSVMLE
jgi:hypothetical protein